MEWTDASFIREWYSGRTRDFGRGYHGLGYNQRSSQERRFEALCRLGDFHGRSLLDVGCGFGDFLAFLSSRGIHPRYHGIDICPEMIDECHSRFGTTNGAPSFTVADVIDWEPAEPFDFVVASGIFGLLSGNVTERIAPTVRKLFGWCRQGAAVNFLSNVSPRPAEGRFYADPAEILTFGLALTPAARLDHGYLPNDFTLSLYAEPPWADHTDVGEGERSFR